jgi:hypothetical protein
MNRRSLLAAAGLAASGGVAVGTGAFSSAEAERTVSVEVAGDTDAYLSLTERPNSSNGGFANVAQGLILFDINDVLIDGEGQGPGSKSVYTFDNVFGVENQGTEDVFFEVQFEDTGTLDGLGFYAGENDESLLDGNNNVAKIPVGEEADMGIYIDTSDEGVESGQGRDIDNISAMITASEDGGEDADNVVTDVTTN